VLLIQSNAVSVIVATDIDRGHDDLMLAAPVIDATAFAARSSGCRR
jgi:hypothetical protein